MHIHKVTIIKTEFSPSLDVVLAPWIKKTHYQGARTLLHLNLYCLKDLWVTNLTLRLTILEINFYDGLSESHNNFNTD